MDLIKAACRLKLDILSLSFVRTVADVESARAFIAQEGGDHIEVFAKIETAMALENLSEILGCVDTINVDRGDLSTDIGILNLARAQNLIVRTALNAEKKVFLATQFLKNMEKEPVPLISELLALHQSLSDGISGIQLSEETAVGIYPVECVRLVFDVLSDFQHH